MSGEWGYFYTFSKIFSWQAEQAVLVVALYMQPLHKNVDITSKMVQCKTFIKSINYLYSKMTCRPRCNVVQVLDVTSETSLTVLHFHITGRLPVGIICKSLVIFSVKIHTDSLFAVKMFDTIEFNEN